MWVEAVGYAPVKGTRHLAHRSIDVGLAGVVGDRRWCLVDVDRRQVLRTVRHPRLLALRAEVSATDAGASLRLEAPGGEAADGVPETTGETVTCDYWGRAVPLALLDGPHAGLASAWLDRPVRLAEAPPGGVVYGGAVSLVTQASAEAVALDPVRCRANVVVAGADAYAEDTWVGRAVRLGEVVVRPRTRTPRCAVLDRHPATGERDGGVLAALADRRPNSGDGPVLGVDGDVVRAGRIRVGDPVRLCLDEESTEAP